MAIQDGNPFVQHLSQQVWMENYKWETDETVWGTFRRVAKCVASIEKDKVYWEEKYYELLSEFKYIPGGRILSNAGTNLKGTTYNNCFVGGFRGKNQDSISSIYEELARQAKTLASEGGYGCNFDVLRPRGSFVTGIGVETSGTIQFMELWDISSSALTKGSGAAKKDSKGKNKIRKGAMLGCLSCWNPGIEEFIAAKRNPGMLTKFNLSVLITKEFIECVKKDLPWNLEFPDTTFTKYDDEWDGNLRKWKEKEYPVRIWKTFESACELWDLIITSTYTRNEPGVIFIDRVNELNNLHYCESISASNPCAEEPLPIDGSCNLGSINITQYVNEKKEGIDFSKLKEDIPSIVRFQDAIIDLTNYPLAGQKEEGIKKRRVGIGYTGYGSMLYLLKIPYASEEALKFTEKMVKLVTNQIYQASSDLAQEKGCFPSFDSEKYLKSKFIKQALTEVTVEKIRQHGIRNSHLTTIAPTGNTSIFANNCSGGLEPVVSAKYTRTIIESSPPEDLIQPINIDWDLHTYEVENGWEWIMEGDEWILSKTFNGIVYKIDRNRGLTREEEVSDYSVLQMGKDFDDKAEYAKNIFNLTVEEHIETMKVFARYIDASISKTINVPNNYAYENFKNVYMQAYDSGYIKGITTYREGTMANVLSVKGSEAKYDCAEKETPERPKSVPCHIHRITVKGEKWLVFVGLDEGYPFEVFAGKVDLVDVPSAITEGSIIRLRSGVYQLEYDGEIIIKDIGKIFDSSAEEAITRLISLHLKRRTPIYDLIEQLSKSYGTIIDFNKSITRALKKYMKDRETSDKCPTCGANLVYQEGCLSCRSCGMAKCG